MNYTLWIHVHHKHQQLLLWSCRWFLLNYTLIMIAFWFFECSRCFSTNGTNKRASLTYCWHAVPIMTVAASHSEVSFIKTGCMDPFPALSMDGWPTGKTQRLLHFFPPSLFFFMCHTCLFFAETWSKFIISISIHILSNRIIICIIIIKYVENYLFKKEKFYKKRM